jgi:hypothetical protein
MLSVITATSLCQRSYIRELRKSVNKIHTTSFDFLGQGVLLLLLLLLLSLSRSQWERGLRRGSSAVRWLGLRVRIPPGSWMSVSCECCVLSGRGLSVGLVTRPEESYRVWCV